MVRSKKFIFWTVLISETGHILCCALPTVLSILSLFAAFGVMGLVPPVIWDLHHIMHDWEAPIIIGSGALLVLGWLIYGYSKKLDCHSVCEHPPCKPKKDKTRLVLFAASILFAANLSLYIFVHQGNSGVSLQNQASEQAHHHNHAH
ncbi:MAG: hypothetical protein ACLFR0_03790 [Alphaproteobacteria bacterium]